jgi:hypothetical protein
MRSFIFLSINPRMRSSISYLSTRACAALFSYQSINLYELLLVLAAG